MAEKQNIQKSKVMKSGPGSVKSAPNPDIDSTFTKGLSTTVISAPTVPSSSKNIVSEEGGTHYMDFAAEINTNAQDNRCVRSSAISDFPRV